MRVLLYIPTGKYIQYVDSDGNLTGTILEDELLTTLGWCDDGKLTGVIIALNRKNPDVARWRRINGVQWPILPEDFEIVEIPDV